ncbi:hypothetical protein [Streptomyces sp. NPDC090131]|uniref:hypothetical protein n=1 Tax=Streptomyces sp. NPDC090131 TaxID=3365954 RepID=UPI0038070866
MGAEFRRNLETTARFFAETYQVFAGEGTSQHRVQAGKVRTDCTAWCQANAIKPLLDEKFQHFCRFPSQVDHSTGIHYVLGIALRTAVPAPSNAR